MADEPEVQATEEEEQPKKKSKAIFFIILGVGILLLGGGGFFAYTKFLATKPAIEEKDAGSQQTSQPFIGEIYALEPFVVNLADPKGKRYLKVKIEIELESATAVEQITKVAPKLRDMVIMMLTSLSFEEVMTPEGKIRIRDELLERFNQIMRPERIKNIYFTEFVVQ